MDRRPQHGNKRAFAAMEGHEDENGWYGDEMTSYGAFQEYDDEGNYQQSHYAMSAATEYSQGYEKDGEQDSETYAS